MRIAALTVVVLLACGVDEGVPEGKLAVVGDEVIGPEDLGELRTQLGAYAQRRFRGQGGMRGLLAAVVDAELLAQEAVRAGLGDDPRVRWALLEEVALLYLNAELERRVPHERIERDTDALRAHYEANLERFTRPERRSVRGVVFTKFADAEVAQRKLDAGTPLSDLGDPQRTPLLARDDVRFPGMHPVLFTAGAAGTPLRQPVLNGDVIMVGEVDEVDPAQVLPMDDPEVRQQLVREVREPLLAEARADLLEELAVRYPPESPR